MLVLVGLTPAGATSQPGMLPVEQVSMNGFFFFNEKCCLEHSKAPFHTNPSCKHLFRMSLHQQAASELLACLRVFSPGQELLKLLLVVFEAGKATRKLLVCRSQGTWHFSFQPLAPCKSPLMTNLQVFLSPFSSCFGCRDKPENAAHPLHHFKADLVIWSPSS